MGILKNKFYMELKFIFLYILYKDFIHLFHINFY